MFVHGDILVNMSNWIGGYKPDRFYTAITYAGFGYTAMSWTKKVGQSAHFILPVRTRMGQTLSIFCKVFGTKFYNDTRIGKWRVAM